MAEKKKPTMIITRAATKETMKLTWKIRQVMRKVATAAKRMPIMT